MATGQDTAGLTTLAQIARLPLVSWTLYSVGSKVTIATAKTRQRRLNESVKCKYTNKRTIFVFDGNSSHCRV